MRARHHVEVLIPAVGIKGSLPESLSPVREGKYLAVLLPPGQSLMDTLRAHRIRLQQPAAAVINGCSADLQQTLQPGDRVRLLLQIAGG